MLCLSNILSLITTKNTLKLSLTTALNRLKTHHSAPSHRCQPHPTPSHPTHPNSLPPSNPDNLCKTNPCPFAKAPAATLRPLRASSAERKDTPFLDAHRRLSKMAAPCTPELSTTKSSPQNPPIPYVECGTSEATATKNVYTPFPKEPTSALSAATNLTSPSRGNVARDLQPPYKRPYSPQNPITRHFDFLKNLKPRLTPPWRLRIHENIFSHVETPYHPDAFDKLLNKHDLTSLYPFLTRNLRNGFPMGEFPPLTETVIFPNHPSAKNYDKEIKTYLQEEVVARRMFGPFCQSEMEDIMKGPFQSSPLIIDAQPQPNGAPDKIRICRHMSKRDKLHPSTNDYVDSSKFPTRFGPISKVGEIVSPLFNFLSPHPKISCYSFFFLLLCTSTPFRHIHLRPFVAYIYTLSSCTSTPFRRVHLRFFVAYIYALSSCTSMPLRCVHPHPFIAYIYAFCRMHSHFFVVCIHAFCRVHPRLFFVACIHAFFRHTLSYFYLLSYAFMSAHMQCHNVFTTLSYLHIHTFIKTSNLTSRPLRSLLPPLELKR